MKKSYLMIAVAAIAMVSCAQDDQLKSSIEESNLEEICFKSFSEKATRGNVDDKNNLEFYHQTFTVYGTKKNDIDEKVTKVFDRINCTYTSGDAVYGDWKYNTPRYWDKQAAYRFRAFAPAGAGMLFKYAEADNGFELKNGNFTLDYTLGGTNVATMEYGKERVNGFSETIASGDIDIMTSNTEEPHGSLKETVNLQFKHILSKLNVAVAKSEALASADVTVNYVKISGLKNKGSYSEASSDPVQPTASGAATKSGWSAQAIDGEYVLESNASGDIDEYYCDVNVKDIKDYKFFIESIVMPQDIASGDATVEINYTTTTTDEEGKEYAETFTSTFDMNSQAKIADFAGRCNYTLRITIDPEIIQFDATVFEWATASGDYVIE